jgi:hypothetical protein
MDIEQVYELVEQNELDEAVDILFATINELCSSCNFEECDSLLQSLDINRLDTNLIVSVLAITLAAKEKLSTRKEFVSKAKCRLTELCPDRVDRLLDGLL